MKGYILVRSEDEEKKSTLDPSEKYTSHPDEIPSYASQGWKTITTVIEDKDILKVSAAGLIEAHFQPMAFQENKAERERGSYLITAPILRHCGKGTFFYISLRNQDDVEFNAKDAANFSRFFLLRSYSSSKDRMPILLWRIVL